MYYFVSDVHLGSGGKAEIRRVEKLFVEWLEMVSHDADAIFLCGDIFDFWFEYQRVIPKGFVRTLGKIAELTDRGIRIVYMVGNHDMWVGEYLSEECGVELYTAPKQFQLGDKIVHVAHGDNLNVNGDWKLKMLNKLFRSSGVRWLFSHLVHPDAAMKFGLWWSEKSRKKHTEFEGHNTLNGKGINYLVEYAALAQQHAPSDHYIYGHLHQTLQHQTADKMGNQYTVTFICDWSKNPTYAVLDSEGNMRIEKLKK